MTVFILLITQNSTPIFFDEIPFVFNEGVKTLDRAILNLLRW